MPPQVTTDPDETCCCGHQYSEPGRAKSDHRCPVGRRMLCEECVTKGKVIKGGGRRCPTHGTPTAW
jgi:hypothetical protein